MTDLYIIATIVTGEGNADALQAALLPAVHAFREEAGCLGYTLLQDQKTPGRFVTYERWSDADALRQHMKSATLSALQSEITPLLTQEMTQAFLDPLLIL
jgi:quinol monooxygenase YgiN